MASIIRTKPLICKKFHDLTLSGNATTGYAATQADTDFRGEYYLSDGINDPLIKCTNNTGSTISINAIFLANVYCSDDEIDIKIQHWNGVSTLDIDTVTTWDTGKGQVFWADNTGIIVNNNHWINILFQPSDNANKVRCGLVRTADVNDLLNNNCISFKPDKGRNVRSRADLFETDGGAVYMREEKTYLHNVDLDYDSVIYTEWETFWYNLVMDQSLRTTGLYISDISTDAFGAHNAVWGKVVDYSLRESSLGGTRVLGQLNLMEL